MADQSSAGRNFDQIERSLSPAMRRVLTTEYDFTMGGDVIVASRQPSTLYALRDRGMVQGIEYPSWGARGPYTATLTPLGRGWRRELRRRCPGDHGSQCCGDTVECWKAVDGD